MNDVVTKAKQDVASHATDAWNYTARGLTKAARLLIAIAIFFLVAGAFLLDRVDQWLERDATIGHPEPIVDELRRGNR